MGRLVVGDPCCSFEDLTLLFDEPSISTLKIEWWSKLAMHLDIPQDFVKIWQLNLNMDKMTHSQVILEILKEWRNRNGEQATLEALYTKIPNEKKQLKDYLQKKIREKAKYWKDLDKDSQNVVLRTNVKLTGQNFQVSSLQDMLTRDEFEEIMNNAGVQEYFIRSFNDEEWDLGDYQIPCPLPYYVKRKLALKRTLNPKIFKHSCSDNFVFEGIEPHHLFIHVKPNVTESSTEQILQQKLTTRFILLYHPEDLPEIIKLAKEDNVHRIKYENGQFYWMSTHGSCQIIRFYLYDDEVEEIDEKNFVQDNISTFNNRPIAICSSPGMGKSVFLSRLAREIGCYYKKRFIIYLGNINALISELQKQNGEKMDSGMMKNILASCSSASVIGREILMALLNNEKSVFEIFIDGFDEISTNDLDKTKCFLKILLESPNMRVHMTSRPHMQNDIENMFEVISLDIAPLNTDDQLKFLTDFWTWDQKLGKEESDKLTEFALRVLECLHFINQDDSSQTEFTEIPLQCFMLASIYGNMAKMSTNRPYFDLPVTNTLYDMYKKFLSLRFEKVKKDDRKVVKMFHVREALTLLFPGSPNAAKIVQELTTEEKLDDVPHETIYAAGILEYTSDKPSFVHRTFAEYFLAEFIAHKILTTRFVEMDNLLSLIIEDMLHFHVTTKGKILSDDDIRSISAFIKSSESWSTITLQKINTLKAILFSQLDISLESIDNDLDQILHGWHYLMGPKSTIETLARAIESLGLCSELTEGLHKKVLKGQSVLTKAMMCSFVDTALEKSKARFTLTELRQSEHVWFTRNADQLIWKLLLCIQHGYQYLTEILVEFYKKFNIFNKVINMDNALCKFLVTSASNNGNVDLFSFVCNVVKSFQDINLNEYFKTVVLKDREYQCSPLSVSIWSGNYNMVQHLLNYIGDERKEIADAWLVCFVNNWRDSPNVILNKKKILHILPKTCCKCQIKRIKEQYPNGVNVVLLHEVYDIWKYTPTERDAEYMKQCVSFCCRNEADMESLVDWILSKNLAHLLTYERGVRGCLLSSALNSNLAGKETLLKINEKHCFDLGIVFDATVLCKRYKDVIGAILEISGQVNLRDKEKNTLLHKAALFGKIDVISLLIDLKADVNSRNCVGNTPLHIVFQTLKLQDNLHLVHDLSFLLITNGADVCAKNLAGISPIELAKVYKDEIYLEDRTLELLEDTLTKQKGREICPIEILEYSLTPSEFQNSPKFCKLSMDAVVCNRYMTFVQNMVEMTGNVNISDIHKSTLLQNSALCKDFKAVEYLLLNGADANLKDDCGNTPLHYVFGRKWKNCFPSTKLLNANGEGVHNCVEILIKHDAKVSEKNKGGEMPLDWAFRHKNELNIEDRTISLLARFGEKVKVD